MDEPYAFVLSVPQSEADIVKYSITITRITIHVRHDFHSLKRPTAFSSSGAFATFCGRNSYAIPTNIQSEKLISSNTSFVAGKFVGASGMKLFHSGVLFVGQQNDETGRRIGRVETSDDPSQPS